MILDPDGPEARAAFYDESFSRDADEAAATVADEARDDLPSDLLDIAQARITSFFMDKVL